MATDALAWKPNPQLLNQSAVLLHALRDPSRNDHQLALNALQTEVVSSDFVLHMLHIFSRGGEPDIQALGVSSDVRQLSGLILKNYSFPHFGSFSTHVQLLFEREVLFAVKDPVVEIRKTACILLGKIASTFGVHIWSQVFHTLVAQLESTDGIEVDGALLAIKLICEDACDKLVNQDEGKLLGTLIPKLMLLFKRPEVDFRLHAIESMIAILSFLPASVTPIPLNVTQFIQELSALANDPSPEVCLTHVPLLR